MFAYWEIYVLRDAVLRYDKGDEELTYNAPKLVSQIEVAGIGTLRNDVNATNSAVLSIIFSFF